MTEQWMATLEAALQALADRHIHVSLPGGYCPTCQGQCLVPNSPEGTGELSPQRKEGAE